MTQTEAVVNCPGLPSVFSLCSGQGIRLVQVTSALLLLADSKLVAVDFLIFFTERLFLFIFFFLFKV